MVWCMSSGYNNTPSSRHYPSDDATLSLLLRAEMEVLVHLLDPLVRWGKVGCAWSVDWGWSRAVTLRRGSLRYGCYGAWLN